MKGHQTCWFLSSALQPCWLSSTMTSDFSHRLWHALNLSQVALVVKNLTANAGDLRDMGLIPGLGRCPGGGHGNPLQYSCLENPMDRGAWWDTVHRAIQSRTRLKLMTHACTPLPNSSWPSQIQTSYSFTFITVMKLSRFHLSRTSRLKVLQK